MTPTAEIQKTSHPYSIPCRSGYAFLGSSGFICRCNQKDMSDANYSRLIDREHTMLAASIEQIAMARGYLQTLRRIRTPHTQALILAKYAELQFARAVRPGAMIAAAIQL